MYWLVKEKKGKIETSSLEQPISVSYYLAGDINDRIRKIRSSALQAKSMLEAMDEEITPEAVKLLITAKRKILPKKPFITILDEMREVLATTRKRPTMLNYRTRRDNINEFLICRNEGKLTADKFRYSHFEAMQVWMWDQKNGDGSQRWCKNNINKHLTLVNQVLDYAVNKEYIKNNPIGRLFLEYDREKPPQYLRADARKRIAECNVTTLEKEIDIAVFLMHTGLSYTDYLSLDDEHLYRLPGGEYFIKKQRGKSEVYSIVPLLKEAQEVIGKYGSIRNMPRPDISDYNKMLKVLGELSKSPYILSTSTFRETFSSMMENEYMIVDRLLMFMMGHTNSRQLKNYSSVMPERLLHELKKNDINLPFNLTLFEELVKAS